MAGIDNIIRSITAEAEAKCEGIRGEAGGRADAIRKAAADQADAYAKAAEAETAKEVEKSLQRYTSAADTKKKQAYLYAKQSMIASCLEKARQTILAMDDPSYFGMIAHQIGARLAAKEGTLFLSEKDRARMPEGFLEKISAAAAEKGGSVSLSDETCAIDGGFILSYGGIEENCSVDALFEEYAEELSDTVGKLLFN